MERTLLKTFLCLFFILMINSVWSQQREYIIGKLLDAKTQEPIAFASIRIKDRALGVISNTDGSFKIPLKYKEYGDIIEISSMGYQSLEMLIHDFSIYELNNVRLEPALLELDEALVTAKIKRQKNLSARKIVRIAIDRISKNYPLIPYSKVGYYRDYQLDNGEYINLNEAILEVFDKGFNAVDSATTKTRIYDYIKSTKFKRDTLSDNEYDYQQGSKTIVNAYMSGYGGNEFSALRVHDAIRNYELNTYDYINGMKDGDILNNHAFKKMPDIYLNDKLLFVIQFGIIKNEFSARGRMYIAKSDFGIHKLEYAVYDNSRRIRNKKPINRDSNDKLIFEVNTEYQKNSNDKMYLNYISFHNTFQLRQPPKFALKFLNIDLAQQKIILIFTNPLSSENSLDYKNFKGYFKGGAIKFERLVVLENQVWLFPKLKSKKQLDMWKDLKIASENNALSNKIINFDVNNISDIEGNLINERNSKEYNQFREFFVQEVKLNAQIPPDSLFMFNRKPIFENQPIFKPDNFEDYWMNTPLQNINY